MNRRFFDERSNLDAQFEAQKLVFGPLMFEATRAMRNLGVLDLLFERGLQGAGRTEIIEACKLTSYAASLLLEAGLAAQVVEMRNETYFLTKVGYFILRDPMTSVNMNFVHDVCYRPMFHFEDSLRRGEAVGLREFGCWKTIYEGLAHLPAEVQASWFAFDHFYSDGVFDRALPEVFATHPKTVLDVGGNTGKFALRCCQYDDSVQVKIVDLPGQLNVAIAHVEQHRELVGHRISGEAMNLLEHDRALPRGYDVIWMSQFLDCFGEDDVVNILRRAAAAMGETTRLFILETCWDRQEMPAARYSVINTSLYFTAVANGQSKMFESRMLLDYIARAGLCVESDKPLGFHTLLRCRTNVA
jgi:hypothetical protein